MRVTPVTKEVADAGGMGEPFKAGDYDFIISTAEETLSKTGNEMLKLQLHVFNRDGDKRIVFDYILSSESAQWKARHMMESIGMARRYDQGVIEPREIEGKPGRCKLNFVPAGQYPAKNSVADYLGPKGGELSEASKRIRQPAAAPAGSRDLDDEIPF
jgi:hypothetical protein